MRKLDDVIIAVCFYGLLLAYLSMSKITANSNVARRMEQTASLRAAAELKRTRNDAASEREHLRLMRKVEHEFDDSFGKGGILQRGLARVNSNSLTVPAERKRQLISSTSGRSFHGKGATYRKDSTTTNGKGRRLAASPAAAHYRYIDCVEHEIDPAAARLGSHVSYIDGSRVEQTDDGERLSRSNIEGDFVDRMRFFELAEQFERHSHGDKISVDPNRTSSELAAVYADPTCDPAVRAAIAAHPLPHKDVPLTIQLEGSNKDLRRLLEAQGIVLSTAKTNDERRNKDGIAFHSGRSGRTHFRWVFELPLEFDAKQREQVLGGLCAHMDQLKCMYAAVIHAPDPHNDERNHHLHLIFYDRPCRRLDGTKADFKHVSKTIQGDIQRGIAAGEIQLGEWDFATQRHYKSIRTWKTHYPFRAEKSREVTKGKDWQKRFRHDYATIVNKVSAASGGSALYDPRSYKDRNVDISPSKHLGQLHKSEVAGIPTLIGLENEGHQTEDQRRGIYARHQAELATLSALDLELAPYRPSEMVDTRVSKWAAQPLDDLAEARLTAEAKLAMDLWLLETARERSRAVLVRDRQRRAAEKGKACERRARETLAVAAEAHLGKLDREDAELQRIVADVQQGIDRAPRVTEESIQRAASSCDYLRKQYPVTARQAVSEAKTKVAEASVELPTMMSDELQPKVRILPPRPSETIRVGEIDTPEGEKMRKLPSRQGQGSTAKRQPPAALVESADTESDSPLAPIHSTRAGAETSKPLIVPPLPIVHTPTAVSETAKDHTTGGASTGGSAPKPHVDDPEPLPRSSLIARIGADEPSTDAEPKSSRLPQTADTDLSSAPTQIVGSLGIVEDVRIRLADVLASGPIADLLRATAPSVQAAQPVGVQSRSVTKTPARETRTSGVVQAVLQPAAVDPAVQTDSSSTHQAQQQGDPLADAGNLMRLAWIRRIEDRHVRLVEKDGVIFAAPDQRLVRGDDVVIASAQEEFWKVKARQDRLAIEVAECLCLNSARFVAGKTDSTDALTLKLKDKWANDPAIASAVKRVWGSQTASATVNPHEALFRANQVKGVA